MHIPKLMFVFFFQFTAWVDAVIFVFSLENEASFNAIYNYYTKMSHFRNSAEIPLILVGTQGEIIVVYLFYVFSLFCINKNVSSFKRTAYGFITKQTIKLAYNINITYNGA